MDKIFNDYYDKLYYWSLTKTKNIEDARDLINDIFVAIYSYTNELKKIDKIDNLIWKISYNCWCNFLRKKIKDKSLIYDEEILNTQPSNDQLINKLIYNEIMDNLEKFGLLKIEIECFKLYYENDLSIKEISNKINISESNIKYYLLNSRKKIKERMK